METKPIAMNIRFPLHIWRAVRQLAAKHNRSFHGEVIEALSLYIQRYQRELEEHVSRETIEEGN